MLNPGGRMDDRELTTDAHPRFRGAAGRCPDRQETSAQEHATGLFAKRVELPKDLSWLNERQLEGYFAKGSGRAP